ncbi:MAG: lytic transglycosylase domain-containing protein [Opitutus sp.]|nr:lytic transglycosylase domain-containing protein [Opitutus sp.]MCS6246949.1 lytic transglycosylase domain-containing protein [Opitutus sp.]MCS6275678.1 lytic transglycosylase domain-containing protein [Opitutus sp.]MCS6276425.1 lytic transglycosylase domain-containing protein [Opitutus sp.]MCS6301927.1 lytic transglycosylase domain-containing protein [Opitutus sp.]
MPLLGLAAACALASTFTPTPLGGARLGAASGREGGVFELSPTLLEAGSDAGGERGVGPLIFPSFRAAPHRVRLMPEKSVYDGDARVDFAVGPAAETAPPHSARMVEIVFTRPPPPRAPDPGIRPSDVDIPLYKAWVALLIDSPRPRRAQTYLSDLKKIFAAEGLPEELVWLAEAESNFDPRALNASGARGLFQLMPYTARELGLRLQPQDERDDPRKNARAAAVHLRHLYGKFDSWSLALAAYNAGEGYVRRSLKAADAQTYGEIAESLPLETRVYVAKTLALLVVREALDDQELDVLLGH